MLGIIRSCCSSTSPSSPSPLSVTIVSPRGSFSSSASLATAAKMQLADDTRLEAMDADASVKAEVATIAGLPTRTGKLTAILAPGTAPTVRKMLGVDVTSSQVDRFGNFIGQVRDLNNELELLMISTGSAVFGEHTMTTQRAKELSKSLRRLDAKTLSADLLNMHAGPAAARADDWMALEKNIRNQARLLDLLLDLLLEFERVDGGGWDTLTAIRTEMRELGCTINVYVTVLHIPIITTWVNRASRWYKDHSDTGPCPSLKDVLDWDRADLRLGTSELAATAKRLRKAYNDLLRKQEITLSVGEVVQNAGVAGGAGHGELHHRKPRRRTMSPSCPAARAVACAIRW